MAHDWSPEFKSYSDKGFPCKEVEFVDAITEALEGLSKLVTGGSETVDTHLLIAEQHLRLARSAFCNASDDEAMKGSFERHKY